MTGKDKQRYISVYSPGISRKRLNISQNDALWLSSCFPCVLNIFFVFNYSSPTPTHLLPSFSSFQMSTISLLSFENGGLFNEYCFVYTFVSFFNLPNYCGYCTYHLI